LGGRLAVFMTRRGRLRWIRRRLRLSLGLGLTGARFAVSLSSRRSVATRSRVWCIIVAGVVVMIR